MFEVLLHTGTEHSNLTLSVLSSILAFVVGVGVGTYSATLRKLVRTITAD